MLKSFNSKGVFEQDWKLFIRENEFSDSMSFRFWSNQGYRIEVLYSRRHIGEVGLSTCIEQAIRDVRTKVRIGKIEIIKAK